MTRVILHVDMNAFFAAVEQKTYPHLRGKPIIVCGDPNSRTAVASASYEARVFGIRAGMNLYQARQLCPSVIAVAGNPAKYVDTAIKLGAIFTRFTDLVEIFSIDEVFLDITNTVHIFGGAREVARRIKELIYQEYGLFCSVGIAPNKLLAKLASDMQKPDGLVVIEDGEVPALLDRLPVREFCGIGAGLETHLARLGIRTAGDLGRYPEAGLVRVFGINGHKLHLMGRGIDRSPVQPYYHEPAAKSMGHSLTLPADTDDMATVRRHLLQLAEQVGRRLRQDGFRGSIVHLVLRYEDFATVGIQRRTREYLDDGYRIYRLGCWLFDRLYRPPRRVRLLGISVSDLVRKIGQLVLWPDPRAAALQVAVDAVNDRYGEFTVARARILERETIPRVIPPSWRGTDDMTARRS